MQLWSQIRSSLLGAPRDDRQPAWSRRRRDAAPAASALAEAGSACRGLGWHPIAVDGTRLHAGDPEPVFERDLPDPRTYRDFARILEVQEIFPNQLERCLELAEAEVDEFPDADIPYLWVANALTALGRPDEAREALLAGLRGCLRKSFLYNALGELAMREMQAVEMASCFARAVRAQVETPLSHIPFLYLAAVADGVEARSLARRVHAMARRIAPGHDLVPELENHLRKMAHAHREAILEGLDRFDWPSSEA